MIPAFKNRTGASKEGHNPWSIPDWPCPHCGIGILEESEIKTVENEASKRERENGHMGWDVGWIDGNAIGILKCNRKGCSETVAFVGRYTVSEEPDWQPDGTATKLVYTDFIEPTYFYPPLLLIQISSPYPQRLKEELAASFRLYWNEPESCANKIRNCVEHLLTDLKIPRYTSKKRHLPLHQRIERLDPKFDQEITHLMALKIIGNPGSHGQKIDNLDLVNAYEILDHVLKRIYLEEEKRIAKVSKKYIKIKK